MSDAGLLALCVAQVAGISLPCRLFLCDTGLFSLALFSVAPLLFVDCAALASGRRLDCRFRPPRRVAWMHHPPGTVEGAPHHFWGSSLITTGIFEE